MRTHRISLRALGRLAGGIFDGRQKLRKNFFLIFSRLSTIESWQWRSAHCQLSIVERARNFLSWEKIFLSREKFSASRWSEKFLSWENFSDRLEGWGFPLSWGGPARAGSLYAHFSVVVIFGGRRKMVTFFGLCFGGFLIFWSFWWSGNFLQGKFPLYWPFSRAQILFARKRAMAVEFNRQKWQKIFLLKNFKIFQNRHWKIFQPKIFRVTKNFRAVKFINGSVVGRPTSACWKPRILSDSSDTPFFRAFYKKFLIFSFFDIFVKFLFFIFSFYKRAPN